MGKRGEYPTRNNQYPSVKTECWDLSRASTEGEREGVLPSSLGFIFLDLLTLPRLPDLLTLLKLPPLLNLTDCTVAAVEVERGWQRLAFFTGGNGLEVVESGKNQSEGDKATGREDKEDHAMAMDVGERDLAKEGD